jgi:hypothetical protein
MNPLKSWIKACAQVTIAQEVIKIGIHRCAPIVLEIALEGIVHSVKTKWYMDMPMLTPSFVNPRSAARLSDIAFAIKLD